MASTTRNRVQPGVPTGGQFAATSRSEASGGLDFDAGAPCGTCGEMTKRRSGLCRRCDPAKAKKKTVASPVGGAGVSRPDGPTLDRSQPSLTKDEIGQCEYAFVPVYRSGTKVEGAARGCKNAVKLPAALCHQHGGATDTSLGRTVAKARAEAGRGECFPLAAEHWEQADNRLSAAEGQLLAMLGSDTDQLARLYVDFSRQQLSDGVARFSTNNQFLVLVQHAMSARKEGAEGDSVFARALEKTSEPHLTEANWAKLGRQPVEGAEPVAVVWWKPGGKQDPDREEGESDEDYAKRAAEESRFWKGRHGGVLQYPLSATEGDDYEIAENPLAIYKPAGFGDADAAIATMSELAEHMGIDVSFSEHKPEHGYAYWRADTSQIVVWDQMAGGDRRAVAHALAHELGHARLGHSTDAGVEKETADKEAAAESFAYLVCAHHGIDTTDLSAWYVNDWRKGSGVNMAAGGISPLRSAAAAFDDYVAATTPLSELR